MISSEAETAPSGIRCEAVVDLGAVRSNVAALRSRLRPGTALMAVVKADGYGHGAVPVAAAAVRAGADALGVAVLDEAVALVEGSAAAGTPIGVPVACWLWSPDEDPGPALDVGAQIGVSSVAHLEAVLAATRRRSLPDRPQLHLKVDTGLGRGGAAGADIAGLLEAAAAAQRAGTVSVIGLMSHLASADIPGDPSVAEQAGAFARIHRAAAAAGLELRGHLANTAATIAHPDLQGDLVRVGIGVYGLSPVADPAGLRPAMTLRAAVALTKRVPAGHGVSYGLTYRTTAETTLALVPLGYADGIPRAASNSAEVLIAGRRRRIAGRVAMDQFVVDCGDDPVRAGDEVLLFGPGDAGEPTATEWADACGTIDYEIVTRIGPRTPRRHVGGLPAVGDPDAGVRQVDTAEIDTEEIDTAEIESRGHTPGAGARGAKEDSEP